MPLRRAKEMGLPAVDSPVLFDYSEQLAILLFGQLMKWLRPMVRRGDSIPLADLKDALWAVKEAWELHRDIARASGPQQLSEVPAEELDALTAGYDSLIDARDLSVADKRRLQAHVAQQRQVAEAKDQHTPPPAVMSAAEHDALIEQLRILARHPWEVMQDRWWLSSRRAAAARSRSTAPTWLPGQTTSRVGPVGTRKSMPEGGGLPGMRHGGRRG